MYKRKPHPPAYSFARLCYSLCMYIAPPKATIYGLILAIMSLVTLASPIIPVKEHDLASLRNFEKASGITIDQLPTPRVFVFDFDFHSPSSSKPKGKGENIRLNEVGVDTKVGINEVGIEKILPLLELLAKDPQNHVHIITQGNYWALYRWYETPKISWAWSNGRVIYRILDDDPININYVQRVIGSLPPEKKDRILFIQNFHKNRFVTQLLNPGLKYEDEVTGFLQQPELTKLSEALMEEEQQREEERQAQKKATGKSTEVEEEIKIKLPQTSKKKA